MLLPKQGSHSCRNGYRWEETSHCGKYVVLKQKITVKEMPIKTSALYHCPLPRIK